MNRSCCFLFFLLFSFFSCSQGPSPSISHHRDGRKKPAIILPQVKLSVPSLELVWNVREELTEQLKIMWQERNLFYLLPKVEGEADYQQANWFAKRPSFPSQEGFLILIELLQHTGLPRPSPPSPLQEISVYCRVRVVDLRGKENRLLLQEIFHQTHPLSDRGLKVDYTQWGWGSDHYWKTPLYKVHKKLCKQVVQRVEKYILLAQGIS